MFALKSESVDDFDRFIEFVLENTPELEALEVESPLMTLAVNVFYFEAGSKTPKELFWAGDGLQIWLQLLFHLFRQRDVNVVVLDEPDIYLHPDMQRRLVNLIDSLSTQQIILASHAPEVLAEASKGFCGHR